MLFVLYPLRGGPWVPLPYAPWTRSPSLGLLQYAYIASAHLQHTSCLMRDRKKNYLGTIATLLYLQPLTQSWDPREYALITT